MDTLSSYVYVEFKTNKPSLFPRKLNQLTRKKNNKKPTSSQKQRQVVRMNEMDKGNQKVQISGCKVSHGYI